MLENTRGIFLHHLNYSDSAMIARIYTEKYGQQSYIVNRSRSKRSNLKVNLFQPLFLLDLEVYYKPGKNIQRLKNARIAMPFDNLPFDIKKSSQAIFISELLMKCLKEEEANPELFEFLYHAFCLLDLKEEGISNFLVAFLFRLTRYLGFSPQSPDKPGVRFFDLNSASFKQEEPIHNQFMDEDTTKSFMELYRYEMTEIEKLSFKNYQRSILLSKLIEYYKIHLDFQGEIKSLSVLKEVFE